MTGGSGCRQEHGAICVIILMLSCVCDLLCQVTPLSFNIIKGDALMEGGNEEKHLNILISRNYKTKTTEYSNKTNNKPNECTDVWVGIRGRVR